MKWCIYNEDGQLVSVGSSPIPITESDLAHCDGTALFDIPEHVAFNTHYIDGGEFVEIPPQPDEFHVWNWKTKGWSPDSTIAERQVRRQRDALLTACDWTQLPDVPLETKESWAAYRQSLRDIPNQTGFPFDIEWPEINHGAKL